MFADQLSLAGSGTVFSRIRSVFQDVLRKIAGGLGPAIISGPILGRFFRIRHRFFQDVLRKIAAGLGPTIISGPIRWRFFSGYGCVFFRIRQPANVILGYAGALSPGNWGSGLPRGAPQGLSQARFGGVFFSGYGSGFFQDVLNKNAGRLGPAIISGPIRGRFFFRIRLRFFSGYPE